MAASRRRSPAPVIESVFKEPRRFEFFQAVRLLEWQARRDARDARLAGRRPIGHDHDPRREVVRLRSDTSLTFPGNELAGADQPAGDKPGTLTVAVLGLFGAVGVLPQHYTELVIKMLRQRSRPLRDFLDLFNHRALSLFYRAWAKYRLPIAVEQMALPKRPGAEEIDDTHDVGRRLNGAFDPVTTAVAAFVGIVPPSLQNRLAVDDATLLHYSGLLSSEVRSAIGLEAMLSDFLGRRVTVDSLVGSWLPIEPGGQSRLPSPAQPDGQYCRLGYDTVAGERAWDASGRFRLSIGPLDYAQFLVFMPHGPEMAKLKDLTRFYVGPELDFEVAVTLRAEAVPQLGLTDENDAAAPRLGWNTWLLADRSPVERGDAVFPVRDL